MTDYLNLHIPREQLLNISSLGLAHMGDAVFEVMVRSWLCQHGKATSKRLHLATVHYVSAPSQAAMAEKIADELTPQEADVFRRGRNTVPHNVPKAASRSQYQTATALEALFGWLWLQGETHRLNQLFSMMMEGE